MGVSRYRVVASGALGLQFKAGGQSPRCFLPKAKRAEERGYHIIAGFAGIGRGNAQARADLKFAAVVWDPHR